MLEMLDYTSVVAEHRPFYISICISTRPTHSTPRLILKVTHCVNFGPVGENP